MVEVLGKLLVIVVIATGGGVIFVPSGLFAISAHVITEKKNALSAEVVSEVDSLIA
ncbi:MAG: hypothetical protein ACN2B6_00670 [Rickettsiales bacterium]